MQDNTFSLPDCSSQLAEVLSDASGIPAALIRQESLLDADLGLSFEQILDLRYAVEFEFGVEICPDAWMQHCDCISSVVTFLESARKDADRLAKQTFLMVAA